MRSFPRALIACISQAREPKPFELEAMAAKIWNEAGIPALPISWLNVPLGSMDHRRFTAAARAAMGAA